MKALVKFGDGKAGMELRAIPLPEPNDYGIQIKVEAVGVCGTDLHIMLDEYPSERPVVLGHEYTGTVSAVGKKVSGFAVGDWVISLTAAVTCGQCEYCKKGLLMLCNDRKSIGSGVNGAMAEYLVVPAKTAFRIPDNVTKGIRLALSEPIACCIRAVIEMSPLKAGDIAVVSGPGLIGQLTAQLAKFLGAYVVMSGLPSDLERLSLAKKLKAADEVVTSEAELQSLLSKITRHGADIAFECAGSSASSQTCIKMLKKTGHYAQVGLFGKPISLDMDLVLTKELSFSASYASEPSSWQILIELLQQNALNLDVLASPVLRLDDWEIAFDYAAEKVGYKVLMLP